MRRRLGIHRRVVLICFSSVVLVGAMLVGVASGGVGTSGLRAVAAQRAEVAPSGVFGALSTLVGDAARRKSLTNVALHFHGNPSDDPGCTGNGSVDVSLVACNGPKLLERATLGTGTPGHWDPLTPAVNGTTDRNIYDPNWLWTPGESGGTAWPTATTVRLGGPMTISWWASCGACGGGLSADWTIRLWADGVKKFETRVTATPSLPDVPALLSTTVYLKVNQPADTSPPQAITATTKIVLHVDPVFIDSQENTHIYYDSQSACVGPTGPPCDSTVTMPVLAAVEDPPPPPLPPIANPTYTVGGLTFGPATVIDTQRTEGEPVNFIDKNGKYWESGPYGTSTQQSFIHRSVDGGDQFNVVSPVGLRPDPPPGGGDTDVILDDQTFAYFVDLEGLANIGCAVSNDNGNTWAKKNPVCATVPADDRQWLAVDNGLTNAASDNTIFLAYRELVAGSFIQSTPGSTGTSDLVGGFDYTLASAGAVNTGAPCGQLRFDPVLRNLYMPCISGNHVSVTVGHVDPSQRTGIVFTTKDTPASPGTGPGKIFPGLATDGAGNLYVVWIDKGNFNVYYVESSDGGNTWGPVVQVNSDPLNPTAFPVSSSNVFAWARAGAAGKLVVAWYGNDTTTDSDAMPAWPTAGSTSFKWYGYVALVTGANTTTPAIDRNRFTEKPMHYGQICTGGTLCAAGGDRTMADYFSTFLDLDGGIRVAYNDTTSQYHGAHLFEERQLTGPSATTGTLSKPVPSNPMFDATNDAQSPHYAPVTGPNQPQLDFTSVALNQESTSTLRVRMTVSNLTGASTTGKLNRFWITRFQALSTPDTAGPSEAYRIFYVGAEQPTAGGTITYFAGSGSSATTPPGCNTTTPGNCKIVQYPNETTTVTGTTSGNTICIDVPSFLTTGFGPNAKPITGSTLYNVTAFSGGRDNAATDVYADVDATRAFDFPLGTVSPTQCAAPTTAARMLGFGARREGGRVVLRWQTAAETGLLGFNVYRGPAKLNASLIAARGSAAGATYRFVDRTARAGRSYTYRLQVVGRDGTRSWFGPARVRAAR